MYAIMVFFFFTGVTSPALQSLISKTKASNEQGELQGTLIGLASLTAIAGPLLFTSLFSEFTKNGAPTYFPGVAYLTASLICVVALVVLLICRSSKVLNETEKDGVMGSALT